MTNDFSTVLAPHDPQAESAVIGAMLVSEAAVGVVSEIVKEKDFYSETNRVLFNAMLRSTNDGPVDPVILLAQLADQNDLDRIGGRSYIMRLMESVPTASNAGRYARIVKEKSLLREMMDAGDRVKQIALEEPEDVAKALDRAEEIVYRVSDASTQDTSELTGLDQIAHEGLDRLQTLYEADEDVVGVPTGFPDHDDLTTGAHPGDLIILAARPAMGKTAFVLNAILHVAKTEGPVAVFSLEMSKDQLFTRLLSMESGVELKKLRTGKLTDIEFRAATAASARLAKLPIHIDDSAGMTVTTMRAKLRRYTSRLRARGETLRLAAVDYLQLMTPGVRNDSRVNEISEISRALKVLARDLNIPVFAISQLSRAVEQRHDKRPMLSDLRESGSIEQDADRVDFLYRDEYYNPETEDRGIAELIIAKHRNGPTGKVQLAWIAGKASFGSLARKDEYVAGRIA